MLSNLEEGVDFTMVGQRNKKRKKPTEGADLNKIIKMIMEKKMNPVIVFSFSKKDVEGYAMAMAKFDLTSEEEKEKIQRVFESAMECLSEEDKQLPQVIFNLFYEKLLFICREIPLFSYVSCIIYLKVKKIKKY